MKLNRPDEARALSRASTHWLRRTNAIRMVELDLPPDVMQEQQGDADPRATAAFYRAQEEWRARLIADAWQHRQVEKQQIGFRAACMQRDNATF